MIKGSRKPIGVKLLKFCSRHPITGCLEWVGSVDKDGYGTIRQADGAHLKAHREQYKDKAMIDPGPFHVLHHCDNPGCGDITHMYAGTHVQNMQDKADRGRAVVIPRFGKDNPMYGRCSPLNPFYGKEHTEEVKARIGAANAAHWRRKAAVSAP